MSALISTFLSLAAIHGLPLFAALAAFSLALYYPAASEGTTSGGEILNNLSELFINPFGALTSNYLLVPLPLFTLTGFLLAHSQSPVRVVSVFTWITKRFSSNGAFTLGLMALLVMALFTPLTGASGVTIIALGGLLYPILTKAGYSDRQSVGMITAGGSLGLLFFPSIPVIVYGIMSDNKAPIDELFLAGVIPGLLFITAASVVAYLQSQGRTTTVDTSWSEVKGKLFKLVLELSIVPASFALFLTGKVTIADMGGIFFLWFFVFEVLVFKEIDRKNLIAGFTEGVSLIGGILLILFFAQSFSTVMINNQVPQKLFEAVSSVVQSKLMFLVLLNIFLLIVGALMDIFSATVVIAPLIIAVAEKYGIDMVHLGVLFLTNLEIGYITPPVGINLFITSFRFKRPMPEVYKSVVPYLLVLLVAQLMITYIPELSLWYR